MKKQVKKAKQASRQQLVRIAKVVNHRTKPRDFCSSRGTLPLYTYALMLLQPQCPDNNHIYYEWVTRYTGTLVWARAMAKQYGIEIEDLTK